MTQSNRQKTAEMLEFAAFLTPMPSCGTSQMPQKMLGLKGEAVTRRNTPLVPCPQSAPPRTTAPRRAALKAPIVIVAAGKEWELLAGSAGIGRDEGSLVVLEDPLVSRNHASVSVQADGSVVLQDLHSTNGVFINGVRLSRPDVVLCEGDRLLLGTTEISVFSVRGSLTISIEPKPPLPAQEGPGSNTLRSPAPEEPPIQAPCATRRRATVTTGRSAAIDLVGQFAEQMMASGLVLEAVRTLSEPLQNLLKGASAGLSVPGPILESATSYALRLREWTGRDAWVDYVFELHQACQQVPSDGVLQLVEPICLSGARVDRSLVRYLITTLERDSAAFSLQERTAIARLKQLGAE